MNTIAIEAIKVGERHRRDLGDIEELAASIAEVGLLQPIALTFDGYLIAGERRLRAVQLLGWRTIPYTLIPLNLDQIVRGEFAENAVRKDLTLSEAVAIKRALEPLEKAAAKERQGQRTDKHPAKFSTSSSGRALDKVAAVVGKHRTTIAKAEAVVDAAEADPERFGKLKEDMDRTGCVNGPHKRLQVAIKADAIKREPPPLPGNGPYRVIVVDPPWPYEVQKEDPSDRATHPYPQMSIAQICALDVKSIAHDDSILWLWTTNHHMYETKEVLAAWGFEKKQILTWVKDRMGRGDWLRGQTEHALMAVRGEPVVTLTNQTTVLHAPVRAHSQKPEEFYALVESLCPAPCYCELFSRQQRERWEGHGDEAPGTTASEPPPDSGEMPPIPEFLRRPLPQERAPSQGPR